MRARLAALTEKFRSLQGQMQRELEADLLEKRQRFHYHMEQGRIRFEQTVQATHRRLRKSIPRFIFGARFEHLLSVPFIYALLVPFFLLDVSIRLYQAICFPLYGIPKVDRSKYIVYDRSELSYLNWIESLNCFYCTYANGLIGYVQEIAGRTEQYWCPIKHATRLLAQHSRYGRFFEYGDAESYRRDLAKMRADVRHAEEAAPDEPNKPA
jgi:hypothetical protein